ncbi:MAG: hypothetical protein AAGE61_13465 [Pseudomonadota bacterium]
MVTQPLNPTETSIGSFPETSTPLRTDTTGFSLLAAQDRELAAADEDSVVPADLNFRQYAGIGSGQQVLYGQIKGSDQWVALSPDGKGGYTKTNIGDTEPEKAAVQQLIKDGTFPLVFDANGGAVAFKASPGNSPDSTNENRNWLERQIHTVGERVGLTGLEGANLDEKLDVIPGVVQKTFGEVIPGAFSFWAKDRTGASIDGKPTSALVLENIEDQQSKHPTGDISFSDFQRLKAIGTEDGRYVVVAQSRANAEWVALTPDFREGLQAQGLGTEEPLSIAVRNAINDGAFPTAFSKDGDPISGFRQIPPEYKDERFPPKEITTADFNEANSDADAFAIAVSNPREGHTRISTRRVDGISTPGEAKTSLDLEIRQVFRNGKWENTEIVAIGPLVTRDGVLVTQRFNEYPLRDENGDPITELPAAAARARALIADGALTTLTPEQEDYVATRNEADQQNKLDLIEKLPKSTAFESALVSPADPNDPDAPNLIVGGQEAPGITRFEWFTSTTTTTENPEPSLTYMFVPNMVYKGGFTKTVGGPWAKSAFSVGPGLQKFFMPLTDFTEDGYETRTTSSIVQKTEHKGGFYPADGGSYFNPFDAPQFDPATDSSLDVDPLSSAFTDRSFFSRVQRDVNDFQQFYLNANYALDLSSYSLNYRYVPHRTEHRFALSVGSDISKGGLETSTVTGAPYTWIQGPQFQTGIAPLTFRAERPFQPFVFAGEQVEIGVYVQLESNKVSQLTGETPPSATDWHIVNGEVSEGREAWNTQFSDIEEAAGIVLRSQSIVPSKGDDTAPIFVKPNADMIDEKIPGQPDNVVTLEQLADALAKVGDAFPDRPEFKYVTPKALLLANPDKAVTISDPETGTFTKGFVVGDWIETNLAVSLGGPGIYLKPNSLAEENFADDGSPISPFADDGSFIRSDELRHNNNN